jgi:hypothetical protein
MELEAPLLGIRQTGLGPMLSFADDRFVRRSARRGRRHPTGAHAVAVCASLRLHCGARSEVARPNSLRSLRSLRSDNRRESVLEARCARRPRPCAPRRHRNRPRRVPPAAQAPLAFFAEARDVSAKACPGRLRSASEAPSSAGRVARARSALRQLTCRRLFERSERSERSEFGDGPRDRAAQGSRRAATTAEAKRSSLPGHAFAAPTDAGLREHQLSPSGRKHPHPHSSMR